MGSNDFGIQVVLYDLGWPWKIGVKQKYIAENDDFEILRWPYVTFIDIWEKN